VVVLIINPIWEQFMKVMVAVGGHRGGTIMKTSYRTAYLSPFFAALNPALTLNFVGDGSVIKIPYLRFGG
jgi:hypothetical protein